MTPDVSTGDGSSTGDEQAAHLDLPTWEPWTTTGGVMGPMSMGPGEDSTGLASSTGDDSTGDDSTGDTSSTSSTGPDASSTGSTSGGDSTTGGAESTSTGAAPDVCGDGVCAGSEHAPCFSPGWCPGDCAKDPACLSDCSCAGGIDNFCDLPPGACSATKPGGYCDPDGDAFYGDGDWDRGYLEHNAKCG